jgi:predicted dehydrogenase
MSESTVPVAVIGLSAFGRRTLEALSACRMARIVGVADRNAQLAEEVGRSAGVPHFSDNRQLLVMAKPKVVFMAVPPMAVPDLLEACLEHGIHVWKEAPLGRHLSEAAGFTRRFQQAKLLLAVGTQRRFADPYRRAYLFRQRIGEPFLARAHYLFNWGSELRWRGDRQSAGGGALLELGYHFLDLLIWILGLPETVYGATGRDIPEVGSDRPQPPHDTDDTATAILRYPGEAMAGLVACRRTGPVSEGLWLHGREGSIVATGEEFALRNADGGVLDHLQGPASPGEVYRRQAEAFLRAVLAGKPTAPYSCSAAENLLTHAVIDAIYLSDQTQQPERPDDQLRIHGFQQSDCLRQALSEGQEKG